jgi:exopolysaccharide biosynthesis polyprenyl glycosylphosphotransferase
LQRVDIDNLCPEWLAYAQGFSVSRFSSVMRRAVDVLVATALLIGTAPLMLVAALAIKIDSRGPLFYFQERVGLFGRTFMLMKFRSMQANAEKDSGPRWATRSDPRVTRIGALLRLTRVDELPQLFNVLKGDMSLIGPRPERPYFVEQLTEAIPRYSDRSYVKPGVTGWAQVNFPYGASIEDSRMKLSYDLYYVKHRSFFLDLLILFSTVRVILFQEGAR